MRKSNLSPRNASASPSIARSPVKSVVGSAAWNGRLRSSCDAIAGNNFTRSSNDLPLAGATHAASNVQAPGLLTRSCRPMAVNTTRTTDVLTLGGDGEHDISLLDILDHVLNAGVIVHGSIVISLAGVDLVYVGLNVVLTSVETALRQLSQQSATERRS